MVFLQNGSLIILTLVLFKMLQTLTIPFEPTFYGYTINVHFILEYLAFIIAFRYYVVLRKKTDDSISSGNRLSIIIGAIFGALIGSRLIGFIEYPITEFSIEELIRVTNEKTIMGGLFGGLLGVEFAKWLIGEKESSGDLFTLPIILGIFIGRIGCFLSGIKEFTYGKPTSFFMGMDLGDGIARHPTSLYELFFLAGLFFILKRIHQQNRLRNGELFKLFMISYFSFRFCIEFIKPNTVFTLGLSSIQWLCLICIVYYRKFILNLLPFKITPR